MLEHFRDIQKMQDVLHEAQTGLWAIEIDEGQLPRMYADSSMLELLGMEEEPTPEECYRIWYEGIDEPYYAVVQEAVDRLSADQRAEVQYSWNHPEWGKIFVRCGGMRDLSYGPGLCLRGYHQNITDTVILKQGYDSILRTLNNECMVILLCNLSNKGYKVIKKTDVYQDCFLGLTDYEADFKRCIGEEASAEYSRNVTELLRPEALKARISGGEHELESLFRNKRGEWKRLRILPAGDYSEVTPWVILAVDEQDHEIKKKLDEESARLAISQLYKLVVSVNLDEDVYNCIHYSGELLKLQSYGPFYELYDQMADRMNEKDKADFGEIFNRERYRDNPYREGTLRLFDEEEKLHHYSYYAVHFKQNTEEHILLTARNIDDRQEAQRKAEVLSKLCNSYYSVYVFDLENNIEEAIWQEDRTRQMEFPKGTLHKYYEKFVREYVHRDDQEKMRRAGNPQFLRSVLSPEQPVYDVDFRRIYPGRIEWVRSRFSIEEMRDGEVTKVVFANMNINEQKLEELREEQQNRKALIAAYEMAKKANEAKSSFMAQMSHDIRTPMNAIIGMASIAASHLDERERVKNCLETITSSSHHLLKLINEILDMSKIEKGKLELAEEPFDLEEVMAEICTMIRAEAEGKHQEVTYHAKGIRHRRLIGDELRIRQLLLNLANNAVKYTEEGGRIHIGVQEVPTNSPDQGCFMFTVDDNGIGISKEYIDYIFVPFSRADEVRRRSIQGTGLGMSIAQGIVEAMQGDIQVESEVGKGSRFTATLNLRLAEAGSGSSSAASEETREQEITDAGDIAVKGMRLLVVEDNALNLEIVRTLLEESGFEVDSAVNGAEAVDKFTGSAPGTYQAVLMDLQMPVMDGYTAAREIRKSHHVQAAEIPMIALTANAFAEDVARVLAAGMNGHESKPIDYPHLLATLKRLIVSEPEI